jgi:phosphinothricin acetyltransferase
VPDPDDIPVRDTAIRDIAVRPVVDADAEAILAIYNPEVLESTVTFDLVPRTLADQLAWQRERSGALAVLVAADHGGAGDLLGYGSLSQYKERAAYATTVEDSVYVRRDQQGRGVGRLLLDGLVGTATAHGFHAVIARIVGGHDASTRLHAAAGFEIVGTEREVGRKFGRWLDVVVMQKLL